MLERRGASLPSEEKVRLLELGEEDEGCTPSAAGCDAAYAGKITPYLIALGCGEAEVVR